jgi:peptidoglycan hydrolase-like protein with peptidoglycan-binding domain
MGIEISQPWRNHQGEFGPHVIGVTDRLLGSGFSPGAIDGIFGENTRAAFIAFQRDHNLKANGVSIVQHVELWACEIL